MWSSKHKNSVLVFLLFLFCILRGIWLICFKVKECDEEVF